MPSNQSCTDECTGKSMLIHTPNRHRRQFHFIVDRLSFKFTCFLSSFLHYLVIFLCDACSMCLFACRWFNQTWYAIPCEFRKCPHRYVNEQCLLSVERCIALTPYDSPKRREQNQYEIRFENTKLQSEAFGRARRKTSGRVSGFILFRT